MPWQVVNAIQLLAGNTVINLNGMFIYNGTPAAGNLPIFVVAVPGVTQDPFGNGITAVVEIGQQSGGHWHWDSSANLDINNTSSALIATWRPTDQALLFYTPGGGAGTLLQSLASVAGTDQYGNAYPLGVLSQQLTLQNQASAPPSFAGGSVLYSSTAGRPRYKSSAGADNSVQRADVNVSQFTQGNSTTPAAVSSTLTYQAGEGSQGSEYELEIDGTIGTGTTTAQTLSFGLAVDGTILGGQESVGAVFLAINLAYEYTVRMRLTITATGVGGTCNTVCDGQVSRSGVNAGSQTTPLVNTPIGAVGTGKAFDSTSTHSLQVMAFWGGLNTGQTLTTFRTRVTRRN